MLEWNDVTEKQINNKRKYYLTFWSDDKKTLENISERILTMYTRCESCKGEVTPSDGEYLCLGGCGHVKGETS